MPVLDLKTIITTRLAMRTHTKVLNQLKEFVKEGSQAWTSIEDVMYLCNIFGDAYDPMGGGLHFVVAAEDPSEYEDIIVAEMELRKLATKGEPTEVVMSRWLSSKERIAIANAAEEKYLKSLDSEKPKDSAPTENSISMPKGLQFAPTQGELFKHQGSLFPSKK